VAAAPSVKYGDQELGEGIKGRRPRTWPQPAREGRPLLEVVARVLGGAGVPVVTGRFGATLRVESAGDGPVTILLDSAPGSRRCADLGNQLGGWKNPVACVACECPDTSKPPTACQGPVSPPVLMVGLCQCWLDPEKPQGP
jgi:D-Tyr-tRNA(Tyr) deacylase